MTYSELKAIVDNHITRTSDKIPQDTFTITRALNLRLKNSTEAKQDFGNNNPLNRGKNAFYARYKGEYTIYHDENYTYKNFSVGHEIGHHILGHTSDGAEQDHDAQMVAAIIVAPADLVHKHRIKSTTQLAEVCKMPISIAELYWNKIKTNESLRHKNLTINPIVKYASISAISVVAALGAVQAHTTMSNTEEIVPYTVLAETQQPITTIAPTLPPATQQPVPQEPEITAQLVYITPSGEKYHVAGCRHIRGSETVELSVDEAVNLGKEPCKDCIK